jgi:hypothetical protein
MREIKIGMVPQTMWEARELRALEDAEFDHRHPPRPPVVDHMAHAAEFAQKANVGLLCRMGKPVFYIFIDGEAVEGNIPTLERIRSDYLARHA